MSSSLFHMCKEKTNPKFLIPKKKNPNSNITQLHSPYFNHAGPNFLKQSPNFLVWDRSSRGLTVFNIVVVHDDVRTRRVALLLREHPIVLKCSSCNSSQIWFWPVVAAYWKDCPSRRGHGGHDLTSSETLSQAFWRLGGRLRLRCNPPNSLRKPNSHAGLDNKRRQWSQNIKEVNITWTICTIFWCLWFEAHSRLYAVVCSSTFRPNSGFKNPKTDRQGQERGKDTSENWKVWVWGWK